MGVPSGGVVSLVANAVGRSRAGRLRCRGGADAIEEGRFSVNSRSAGEDGPSLDAEDHAAEQAQARKEAAEAAADRDGRVAATVEAAPAGEEAAPVEEAAAAPAEEEAPAAPEAEAATTEGEQA